MKTDAIRRLRAKLADDLPVYGLWVTLESPSITEMAVALGLDWVVIDAEHTHLDWKEIVEHVRATVRSDTVAIVRITERDTGLIKRALDIGADGVAVPWIETAAQLEEAIRDCRYPPAGRRGVGGDRATVWGQCFLEHTSEANEHVLVMPNIESVATIDEMPKMCALDGAELFFFGPADFSASAGHVGQWEGPGVAEQILALKDVMRGAGKTAGVIGTSIDDLLLRREQGFRMLALGTDVGLTLRSLHEALRAVGCDRRPATSLDPKDGHPVAGALPRPPESMRPDRDEVMTPLGRGETVELQEGVVCELLVGEHNDARDLCTGVVTFQPEASLDAHTHPCSESVTVLEGEVEVSVEGRAYRLGPLDNITIPRWMPHATRNPDPRAPARVHVALAASVPQRTPVTHEFPREPMPADSRGFAGAERVTRYQSASRYAAGPGTEFIDFFNADLIPGIEMSGGYGRFSPGGRLPAHLHDFDESISIIDGTATCRVEGSDYALGDCGTAMVPRGRVHYFVNESQASMSMIWVYAGPLPERIVVDDRCATAEGKPWG